MAKQTINIGTAPNDGTGTPLRTAFDYCNLNFTELYTAVGPSGNNIVVPGSATITGALGAAGLNVTGATIPANGVYLGSANNLSFSTASTLGMTLNSTGLGVGKSPAYRLDIAGAGNFEQLRVSNSAATSIGIVNTTSGLTYTLFSANTASNGFNGFGIFDGSSYVMRIDSAGNVCVGVPPAGTGGCLQLKSGITFPATQVASSDANTLDDYEEGTFTPTIQGSTTTGVGTYVANTGRYTKVGNLVTFQVYIEWTAHTGVGNMRIGGLPFTNATNFWAGSIGYANNIALTAGNIMTGYVESASSFVTLSQYPTGGGVTTGVPIDTAGAIIFSASYTV